MPVSSSSPLPPSSTPPTSDDAQPVFQYTQTGRNKGKSAHPLMRVGGQYVRTVEMFILPSVIMTAGLVRENAPDDEEYTLEEERKWDIWQSLTQVDKSVFEGCKSDKTMVETARLLQLGASSSKALDTHGIKTSLPIWWERIKGTYGSIPMNKIYRGFGDPVCGMLLCPVELDWNLDEVKENLRAGTATIDGIPVDGSDWPAFLHSSPFNRDHPWLSFLRGPLLVKAFRHVFTSPTSAHADIDIDSTTAATRAGNAQIYGMTAVTNGSIAYVATQVLFALTSLPTFNKNHKSLDAIRFYNSIIDYLNDPDFHAKNVALLKWWNLQIFPRSFVDSRKKMSSAHERMKAALKAVSEEENPDSSP